MIVNPDKFQAIILHPKKNQNIQYTLNIGEHTITSLNSVSLLGIEIDNQLTFSKHIETLMRKAAGQLNYLYSKRKFINIEAKKVLIESFIMSNFNYCPLVWMFCNANLKRKQENIQKRALNFLFDDYKSTYKQLLEKANKKTIEIRKLRMYCIVLMYLKTMYKYKIILQFTI